MLALLHNVISDVFTPIPTLFFLQLCLQIVSQRRRQNCIVTRPPAPWCLSPAACVSFFGSVFALTTRLCAILSMQKVQTSVPFY
jgi:hypothetical protein